MIIYRYIFRLLAFYDTVFREIKIIGEKELLPVRTEGMIPKEKFAEAEEFCKNFRIPKPIRIGDILVENFLNTGVHLISLKTVS